MKDWTAERRKRQPELIQKGTVDEVHRGPEGKARVAPTGAAFEQCFLARLLRGHGKLQPAFERLAPRATD
jgi:hypothetical protein